MQLPFRKPKNTFKRPSLFVRINLTIVFLLIVIMLIVCMLLMKFTVSPSLQKDRLLNKEATANLSDVMRSKYRLIYNQSNLLLSHDHIATRLQLATAHEGQFYSYDNSKFVSDYFDALFYADPDIMDVLIVPLGHEDSYTRTVADSRTITSIDARADVSNRVISASYAFKSLPIMEDLLNSEHNICAFYDPEQPYVKQGTTAVITFASKIFNPFALPKKEVTGVFLVNYPVSVFSDAYQQLGALSGGKVYAVNDLETVIFSNDPACMGHAFPDLQDEKAEITVENIGISGISVISLVSGDVLWNATWKLVMTMLMVITPGMALIILLIVVFNRRYQRKINGLADAMECIAANDFAVYLPVEQNDEIGRLATQFNRMCEALKKHIQMHYEAEILRRKAELNALQAQISPHFLFNTIESIRMSAISDGAGDVAEMLLQFGQIFHWMIQLDKSIVYVEDEIEYNEAYLSLQKIRYKDSFESVIHVQEEALYLGLPKFSLQPIVENALQHGLNENGLTGTISISVEVREDVLVVAVHDDGEGMPPERLKQLQAHIRGEKNHAAFGIGMRNVHSRIQMLFGPQYGVRVNSVFGKGTTVTIEVPALAKKEMERSTSLNAEHEDACHGQALVPSRHE